MRTLTNQFHGEQFVRTNCKLHVSHKRRITKDLYSLRKQIHIALLFLCLCLAQTSPMTLYGQGESRDNEVFLEFSEQYSWHDEAFELELYATDAKIYYTIDGSEPNRYSKRYRTPLKIDRTIVVRAVAYKGRKKSDIIGHTYFIGEEESNFPTVSLMLNPKQLFDPEYGLFMEGYTVNDSIWSKPGANFWSRREIKANTEIFDPSGKCIFRSPTGWRLFGGMSRLFPQKSMVLVARDDYGKKRFKHHIFGKEELKKYKFLTLRNSGSDFGKAQFRDAFMTSLVKDWDLETQASQGAHVFINGKYWGIYNIREKLNRYYVSSHFEVDKDSVDILAHKLTRKRGSTLHYRKMLKFIENHDLSDQVNFDSLNTMMEIDNFMEYKIAQIYFDNEDAGGNIKYWRPQTEDGRWRWLLYDTDWGFCLHDDDGYKNNSLKFHTATNGREWPNPPWSTLILRKLLENKDFETKFVSRFLDHLNDSFNSDKVLTRLYEVVHEYESEMPRHWERWNLKERRWWKEIDLMERFAEERPAYMRKHLQEMFDAGDEMNINLCVEGGGVVKINDHLDTEDGRQLTYFKGIPVQFEAVPNFGFRFSHWEGVAVPDSITRFQLTFEKKKEFEIKAVFEPFKHPLANQIVINEVSCNNKRTGDWVEIFNRTDEDVNINNWILTDLKNEFRFPNYTIPAKSYVIVSQKEKKLRQSIPNQLGIIGDIGYGLSKRREVIQLYSHEGDMVDSIGYLLEPTDSIFTYNLLLPDLENGDEENWVMTPGLGTPGSGNPYYIESKIRIEQERYVKIGALVGLVVILLLLLGVRRLRRSY